MGSYQPQRLPKYTKHGLVGLYGRSRGFLVHHQIQTAHIEVGSHPTTEILFTRRTTRIRAEIAKASRPEQQDPE